MKYRLDKKYTKICGYVIVTVFIILVLSKVLDYVPAWLLAFVRKMKWILDVLSPLFYGFIIAYLLKPVTRLFEKLYKGKRGLAVFSTLLVVLLFLTLMVMIVVFSVRDQLKVTNIGDFSLVIQSLLDNVNQFYSKLLVNIQKLDIRSEQITDYVQKVSSQAVSVLTGFLSNMLLSFNNASGAITKLIFSLIIGIYLMLDGDVVSAFLNRFMRAACKEETNNRVHELLDDLDHSFSGYIRGQGMDMLLMMVIMSVALSIVGVKFAIMIGFFAGLFNLIPLCGPIVAYGLTILICLVNGEIKKMLIALIVLVVIQFLDGNIMGPKLLSESIDIHPLLVFLALIVSGSLGGLVGMLVAVPIVGFLKIEFMKWLCYLERKKGICPEEEIKNSSEQDREDQQTS